MAEPAKKISTIPSARPKKKTNDSELLDALRTHRSGELIFGLIGYAGSGTSFVSTKLNAKLESFGFTPHIIKARSCLDEYAKSNSKAIPDDSGGQIQKVIAYQNLGDQLRESSEECGAVVAYMIKRVKELRADNREKENSFIFDSLKHPAEVHLLRHIYGENFCLIGVGCRPDVRRVRLARKFGIALDGKSKAVDELDEFINRDAEDSDNDFGQHVSDTFHLSDYFIDNTPADQDTERFVLPDNLIRLLDILCDGKIHRPKNEERGLYHAHAASLRSSCLSRQVGASIMDAGGNLLSVGTNDVPRFGGGLYTDLDGKDDDRCFKKRECCSNSIHQLNLIKSIFLELGPDKGKFLRDDVEFDDFCAQIKNTRIKSLIEFSRSVHAEMDALLALIRQGIKLPKGSILYTTTYPCHNCARHIVAAGIEKVVYLEPYSKSMAIDLHDDSIADNLSVEESTNKVVFIPYQGVSPRLYKTIFSKSGDLKDKNSGRILSGKQISRPGIGLLTKTFKEFEDQVTDFIDSKIGGGDKDEDKKSQ